MDLESALWRDETLRWRSVVISACMARCGIRPLSPAAYCALLAMMRALERDYLVRAIVWLERRLTAADATPEMMMPLRDYPRDLERARAEVRPRRPRKKRRVASDS